MATDAINRLISPIIASIYQHLICHLISNLTSAIHRVAIPPEQFQLISHGLAPPPLTA